MDGILDVTPYVTTRTECYARYPLAGWDMFYPDT